MFRARRTVVAIVLALMIAVTAGWGWVARIGDGSEGSSSGLTHSSPRIRRDTGAPGFGADGRPVAFAVGSRRSDTREPRVEPSDQASRAAIARGSELASSFDDPPDARGESSLTWPVLDPPIAAPDELTARITGHDPIGDRALRLWRRIGEVAVPIKDGRSAADGHFDFGEIPIPDADYRLVVTSVSGDPRSASPTSATRSHLHAPGFEASRDGDTIQIRFHPAVHAGELLVTDGADVVWYRIVADGSPLVATIAGGDVARNHFVVQVLPDGRRSPTTPIHVGVPGRRSASR